MKTGSCLWEEFSVRCGFESVLRSVGSLLGWAVSLLTPLSPRLLYLRMKAVRQCVSWEVRVWMRRCLTSWTCSFRHVQAPTPLGCVILSLSMDPEQGDTDNAYLMGLWRSPEKEMAAHSNIPPRGRNWQPTAVFWPGQRSLAGYSPWGGKELGTTDDRLT